MPLLSLLMAALLQAERVHVDEATGQVTLAGNLSRLVDHSDPSKWDVITDMQIYRGRLIASACMDFRETYSACSQGAQILEFDPETDGWKLFWEQEASMFFNLRLIKDRLFVPECYPFNERSRRIHVWDASIPKGTSLKLRVRTAESADKLVKAGWKELSEASLATMTVGKGHAWAQVRADFESDGRRTPLLKAVRFSPEK